MKYNQYKKWKSKFYQFWRVLGVFWVLGFFHGVLVRLLFRAIWRIITEKENAPWSSLFIVLFLSHSFLPSFPKIRKIHSFKIHFFFIIRKLKHIPATVTISIMDNSYCIPLELRCYSPEWLWDPDHINLSMNFGNDKIKSHLYQTVYQYAVSANVRKYHSLYKQ